MRPDPYKRAKSRQYQAKHGMLPVRKSKEAEILSNLPSNISQDNLTQILATEEESHKQIEFDSLDETEEPSIESNVEKDLTSYALPIGVIDYLMEDKESTILTEADAHKELINQYPDDLNELFSRMPKSDLIYKSKEAKSSEVNKSPLNTPKASIIQLKSSRPNSIIKPAAKEKSGRTDKLELEDWLDEVL